RLDRVEAVLDEGGGGVDRRLQLGEAAREVADEPLALREGGADTGVRAGGRRRVEAHACTAPSSKRSNQRPAVATSLSPRPERFTSTTPSVPSSRPMRRAPARACADSIAGMMPSVRLSSRSASIASASLAG